MKTPRPTRVDAEGRFAFNDLPASSYAVVATAPGYIDETFASSSLSEVPRHLIGSQITIRMAKGGVITGIVTNAKGEPMVNVPVGVSRLGDQSDPISAFAREGSGAATDDRGIYRVYGLPPGEYVVTAGGHGWFGRFEFTGFEEDAPTFYPSSTRDTATVVSVRSGEETTGVDIVYRSFNGHTISGAISQKIETGSEINVVSLSLWHVPSESLVSRTVVNLGTANRSFSFDGLADGEYEISGTQISGPASSGFNGSKRVTVRGADVTGVDLLWSPLSSIEGTIKLKPVEAEEKCDKRGSQLSEVLINVRNVSAAKNGSRMIGAERRLRRFYANLSQTLDAENTFRMRQLEPGRFGFDIQLPTEAWYVREIRMPTSSAGKPTLEAKPVTWRGTATIKAGEGIKGAVLTIGQDAARLQGTINLPKEISTISPGLQVHLVPAEPEEATNVLRYYESSVDSTGNFSITHVAPGRYFAISRTLPATEPAEQRSPVAWDPTTRAALRRIAETGNNVIELKSCQRIPDFKLSIPTQ